eukprot:82951-Pleurochrysis_carterae.AAC.4
MHEPEVCMHDYVCAYMRSSLHACAHACLHSLVCPRSRAQLAVASMALSLLLSAVSYASSFRAGSGDPTLLQRSSVYAAGAAILTYFSDTHNILS